MAENLLTVRRRTECLPISLDRCQTASDALDRLLLPQLLPHLSCQSSVHELLLRLGFDKYDTAVSLKFLEFYGYAGLELIDR